MTATVSTVEVPEPRAQSRATPAHSPQRALAHHQRHPAGRTLEIEVIAGGDPARLARILATMVNNSPMALAEVRAGDSVAYPVPDRIVVTQRGPLHLTLRLRDTTRRLDTLVVEEVVAIVSSMCQVVQVHRP